MADPKGGSSPLRMKKWSGVENVCKTARGCMPNAGTEPPAVSLSRSPWCRTNFDAAKEEGLAEEGGVKPPEVVEDLDVVIPSSVCNRRSRGDSLFRRRPTACGPRRGSPDRGCSTRRRWACSINTVRRAIDF